MNLFAAKILETIRTEESSADFWFVVVPEDVYRNCRPKARISADRKMKAERRMTKREAAAMSREPSLFPEDNLLAEAYQFEVNFHNQLKAKLLDARCPTQVVRESTIAFHDFVDARGNLERDLTNLESAIAWHLSTAAFYKAGWRPWKLASVRDGVCYVGVVFKEDSTQSDPRSACCAAQMFLDSGDGVVFRGALGPWHVPGRGEFHLSRGAARSIIDMTLRAYQERVGKPPTEVFIHGKTRFNEEEWSGFSSGAQPGTNVVGVRIRTDSRLKVFRHGRLPIMRGLAWPQDERVGYLWTKGFVPRLMTYPGREVPKPLLVEVCQGESPIRTVLQDVLALTKLNYNACVFADGEPVTLKFADAVGEILTAGPTNQVPPLPFKHYI